MAEKPSLKEDPHGMVALFAERLNANLEIMGPRPAVDDALVTVKQLLDGSEFIDLSHKGSTGRAYMRVDKRPETHKRRGGGGGMR
jgi:hypothetical protein